MAAILLVEDDPTLCETVAYQLERAGHAVRFARDGTTAVRFVEHSAPDLILLDLMLPRLTGIDVLRLVRAEHDMPVLIISARDSEAEKVASLRLGADDYITKPFSMRELLARVDAALRRAELARDLPAGGVLPLGAPGALELDVARHEVRRHGQRVALSPKEFELLAYLVQHPNQVCSRDVILEAVWGYAYEGETRTVDVHMHWLRQKLEDDPGRPQHLVTVRNYGYKFVPRPERSEWSERSERPTRGHERRDGERRTSGGR